MTSIKMKKLFNNIIEKKYNQILNYQIFINNKEMKLYKTFNKLKKYIYKVIHKIH